MNMGMHGQSWSGMNTMNHMSNVNAMNQMGAMNNMSNMNAMQMNQMNQMNGMNYGPQSRHHQVNWFLRTLPWHGFILLFYLNFFR